MSTSTFSELIAGARRVLRRVSGESSAPTVSQVMPTVNQTDTGSSPTANDTFPVSVETMPLSLNSAPLGGSSNSAAHSDVSVSGTTATAQLSAYSKRRRRTCSRLTAPRKRTKLDNIKATSTRLKLNPSIVDASANQPGDVCEIEEVRACKVNPATGEPVAYLIKWVGQDDEESTWEPVLNLVDAKKAIDRFLSAKNQWRFQFWSYFSQNGKPSGWLDMEPSLWPSLSKDYVEWCNNNGSTPASLCHPAGDVGPIIKTGKYSYQLDFNKMMQTNLDPRYQTSKYIRALPIIPASTKSA